MNEMKKYAFILMGPSYQPDLHQHCFKTPGRESHIFTVQNFQQAKELVVQLADQGFGAAEVCGAFGKEKADILYQLTDKKLPISYVVTPTEQRPQVDLFFSGK